MLVYIVCSNNQPEVFLDREAAATELSIRELSDGYAGDGFILCQEILTLDYDRGYKQGVFDMANILHLEAEKVKRVNSAQ